LETLLRAAAERASVKKPHHQVSAIILFEEKQVRRAWNKDEQKWYFAIADVIAALTGSPNPQVYWRVMKKPLRDEGNQTVTNCNGLKMTAACTRKKRKGMPADVLPHVRG
jgi:hypothetical protein